MFTLCILLTVYKTCGYLRLAQEAAEASMQAAVDEVRSLPDYSERGEMRLIIIFYY